MTDVTPLAKYLKPFKYTSRLWTLWLAAAPWLTKNWLTCQYWGVWGSNNTTTAFWTHSFSLFCQKYLLIVCVRSQIPLPQVPQGAWNKKLISWLGWLRFLCLGWWPSADQGGEQWGLWSGWMRESLTITITCQAQAGTKNVLRINMELLYGNMVNGYLFHFIVHILWLAQLIN